MKSKHKYFSIVCVSKNRHDLTVDFFIAHSSKFNRQQNEKQEHVLTLSSSLVNIDINIFRSRYIVLLYKTSRNVQTN